MWFAVSCHPDALDGRRPRVEVLHVSPCLRVPTYFWDRQCVLPGCPCRGEHYVFTASRPTATAACHDDVAAPPRPLRRSATTLGSSLGALRWKFWKKLLIAQLATGGKWYLYIFVSFVHRKVRSSGIRLQSFFAHDSLSGSTTSAASFFDLPVQDGVIAIALAKTDSLEMDHARETGGGK
ncbi:hypothetical protein HPB51_021146 [Rhipicephalus microplus]|uniref:Uncharacterized protein n=1 Tax=Rhipicephalus microplus TaxID=6941 RepID=A0A9J6DWW9_RHIMP|nr:hypothetical protein HPB51_021146 [Rhipicephalus microplus]